MSSFRILKSFRVQLLLLLAALLVLTLTVQYYVNLRSARRNTQFIAEQQQAIMAGFALGVNSLSTGEYLDQMRSETKQPSLQRIKNILKVDDQGNILDSMDKALNPGVNPDKSPRYTNVKDI